MTRFREICEAIAVYERDRVSYKNHSVSALIRIVDGFVEYIQAPSGAVYFQRAANDSDGVKHPVANESAMTITDDGWWVTRVALMRSNLHASFTFQLRNELDHFKVRIGDSGKSHVVAAFERENLVPIWDEAVSRSIEYLTEAPQRFVERTRERTRGIGFVLEEGIGESETPNES